MIRLLILLIALAMPAAAQDFSARARVDMAQSQVRDAQNGLAIDLHLSIAVPYRVFTLDNPRRLVVDFREIDWQGVRRESLLNADNATDLRFGALRPGWSRLVVDLAGPMALEQAGMVVDTDSGAAVLTITLDATTDAAFAQSAGAPADAAWALNATPPQATTDDSMITIAIDAGHGGIDPGAEHGGVREADIMLQIAFEVAEAINRTGQLRAVMTRDADYFVPLSQRMTLARSAGADAFISLHADALEGGGATGASVYTLSKTASDAASQRMAERHSRGDLLAGVDLDGQDDRIATVLMDLARLETGPAGVRMADALVAGLGAADVPLNTRPRRSGDLAVLNAADFPSALVEVGFLTSQSDRARLMSANGRARIATGIAAGLLDWANAEAAKAPLVRQ